MKNRLLPALFFAIISAILLAGCTSSEPQDLAYSPAPPAASTSQADAASESLAPPGLAVQSQANAIPAPTTAHPAGNIPADINTVAGFPSPPACPGETGPAGCAPKPVASACRTVGNVTTCDAPRDPMADETHYTN